jgi:hypothetical protein
MPKHILSILIPMLLVATSAFAQDSPHAQVEALADSMAPNACIIFPDSGSVYGDSLLVKARSEDEDIDEICLWYRLRPDLNDPPTGDPAPWQECQTTPCMSRPDGGYVFLDTVACIHDYIGWVELLPLSCDVIGNCQDTVRAYEEACLNDDEGNLVPGHFLFYWDTTRCVVRVVSVNDTISPQSLCGFNVRPDMVNKVVINVVDATEADSFTIDVRAFVDDAVHRIDYRNNVTMPCTIDVYVDWWPEGTQSLFVHVENQGNGEECVPCPLIIDLCVPTLQNGPCIKIVGPHEWQEIPCSGEGAERCVPIWAQIVSECQDTLISQVQFWWAPAPGGPWYFIDEVFDMEGGYWTTCWNNHEEIYIDSILHDGDEVCFIAIGYDVNHVPDTSEMVRVSLNCQVLNVQLLIEDIVTTCFGIPKVAGLINLKAIDDTVVSIHSVYFYYKLDSDPDIFPYWHYIGQGEPIFENVFLYSGFNTTSLTQNVFYNFRAVAKDLAGNVMFDLDEDGHFDDSTFIPALVQGSGERVFVDNEAPQPAFSLVADPACSIFNVNPSFLLGGNGKAYVRAGDDITVEISVLPSEDTCEVKKVEYFLGVLDTLGYAAKADTHIYTNSTYIESPWIEPGSSSSKFHDWHYQHYYPYDTIYDLEEVDTTWHHISTGYDPYHFPITFNPWELPEIIPHSEFEDGWWQGVFKAVLYDSLENSKTDVIELYILDVEPYQALIIEPLNDSYVCGDVHMRVLALNPYEISEVTYQYRHQDSTDWTDILNGTSTEPDSFPIIWQVGSVPVGPYFLRAVAKDSSSIPDSNPPTIRVYLDVSGDANGDGQINLADAVFLVNYLFIGGPAPDPLEAGDANCDEKADLADAVYIINYLFIGGPPPCC